MPAAGDEPTLVSTMVGLVEGRWYAAYGAAVGFEDGDFASLRPAAATDSDPARLIRHTVNAG